MTAENGVHINGDVNGEHISLEEQITSPYASRPVVLRIGPNGSQFHSFEGFAFQYPALKDRVNTELPGSPIDLPEVHEDIGHTLAHFIITEQYHPLGLGGISEDARATAEFKRSVLTYCAAKLCGIESLEELTKEKMEHFAVLTSIFNIQKVVQDVSSKLPLHEVWFPEHLFYWIKEKLVKEEGLVHDERVLDTFDKSPLFAKAVYRSVAEMYSEKAAENKRLIAIGASQKHDSAVPSLNGDHAIVEAQVAPKATAEETASKSVPITDEASEPYVNGTMQTDTQTEGEDEQVAQHLINTDVASPSSTNIEEVVSPSSTTQVEEPIDGKLEAPVEFSLAAGLKEDEAAKIENASKATDSEVEAARTKKKSKKKKGKSKNASSGEAQVVS